MRRTFQSATTLLEMIKFQHTVFALPFALTGAMLAAGGIPPTGKLAWIVAACVFARTAAMSFNRFADAEIDARNPRTAQRAIPAGKLSSRFALAVAVCCSCLFAFSAWMLNPLAFALSPPALLVLLGYSYTKRLSWLSHFVLGFALAMAPVGAWIAVRGDFATVPILLALGVVLWTAGFDLIYACQDYEFDRREGLFSVPARFGVAAALRISTILHVGTVAALAATGYAANLGGLYFAGVAAVAILLAAEHLIVNPADLSRIDIAFFTVNSWVGMVIFLFSAADLFV
jgi:4-hydroxybenzoate polyprenyltransferase